MKNWKTTLSGIVSIVPIIANLFGMQIPNEVVVGAVAVGSFITGLFAKDHDVTGK